MSDVRDPFDGLRQARPGPQAPDADAIRARARAITNRRRSALGAAAAAVVAVAAVGVALQTGGDPVGELAQREAAEQADTAATLGATPDEDLIERFEQQDSRTRTEARTGIVVEGDRAAVSQATTADGSGLVARLEIDEAPGGAVFVFDVCNESRQAVSREFTSGQRFDIEVTKEGETVWRWSDGMSFVQVMGTERWEPGECATYRERWDGTTRAGVPARPGRYEGAAVLTSAPPLETPRVGFCIVPC